MTMGCGFNLHSLGETGEPSKFLLFYKEQGRFIYYNLVIVNNSLNRKVATLIAI